MRIFTKNRYVYEEIKESILNGEYKPGERLKVETLAFQFGVSETPIREALRVLQGEGLLKVETSKEISVTKMKLDELQDMLKVRFELEIIATKYAIENISPEDIDVIEEHLKKEKDCIISKDFKNYWKLNRVFHRLIYEKSNNKYLNKIIFELWDKTERARLVFLLIPQSIQKSFAQHMEILEALKIKNKELASSLMREHKLRGFSELKDLF